MLRFERSRWARPLSVLVVAALVTAYSAGIAYAHWTATTSTDGGFGTGTLEVETSDPPGEFDFDCRVRRFPKHAISFIRFWDGAPSEPLEAASPGAVKLEEDGYELGEGDHSVEPPDARLGTDPIVIHIGGHTTITITDWVAKPDGEFVGFGFEVDGSGVWMDVKAGPHIYRGWIEGTGVWPPDDLVFEDEGDVAPMLVCQPDPFVGSITIDNPGSIPSAVFLELAELWADPDTACEWFAIRLFDADSTALVFEGSLCELSAGITQLIDQIDPGQSVTVTIEVSVTPPYPWDGTDAISAGYEAVATWVQWNSPAPPGAYGWWGSLGWSPAFTISLPTHEPVLDGFVTSAELEDGTYRTVFPIAIADQPDVTTSRSGVVCPVVEPGWFDDTFGEPRPNGAHLGIDIPAPQDSPLVAIEPGNVQVRSSLFGGYTLALTTAGVTYTYAHLAAYSPAALTGGWVEAGTFLGTVGSTGNATSPHLHIGMWVDGQAINPYSLLATACLDAEPVIATTTTTTTTSSTTTTTTIGSTSTTTTTTVPVATTTTTSPAPSTSTSTTTTTTAPPSTSTSTTTTTLAPQDPPVPQAANVTGHVWHDTDGDGVARDESGLEGIVVVLLTEGGATAAETKTGANGTYQLGPVDPGTYRVEFHGDKDWVFTDHDETIEVPEGVIVEAVEEVTQHGKRQFGGTAPFQIAQGEVLSFDAGMAPLEPQDDDTAITGPRDSAATDRKEDTSVELPDDEPDPDTDAVTRQEDAATDGAEDADEGPVEP